MMRSPIPLEQMEPSARPVDEAVGLLPGCYTDCSSAAAPSSTTPRPRAEPLTGPEK